MKVNKYIITAVAALLAGALLFCGCSKGNKFEMSEGKYVDRDNGISYNSAPACYEPIAVGAEIYGMLKEAELYEIEGADPEKWLCEGNGSVFYAEDVALPTLGEMNISYVNIVLEETVLAKITNSDVISAIVAAYDGGEAVSRPAVLSEDSYEINWRLKLADESLGLYYILSYIEIDEDYIVTGENGEEINLGKKFIFNRFENKCVVAGDVMDKYSAEFRELYEEK